MSYASHGAPLPSTYDGSICSDSFRCGGVQISYPFYLANATQAAADYGLLYSCGYEDLKIFCQDVGDSETPLIQLGQYNYTVKDISYYNNTILLADAEAFRGGCPVIRHNVTFGPDWLRYTGSNDYLTFLSGCYKRDAVPPGLDAYQISCPGFSDSMGLGGVSFMFSSEQSDKFREFDLADRCSEIVVRPVLSDSLARMSNRSMLRSQYGGVLRQGFEMAWNWTATDQCYRCEQSGGRCSYSQNKVFLGCFCSDKKVGIPDCSNRGASSTRSPSSFRKRRKRTAIYIVASTLCLLPLCLIILVLYLTHKNGSFCFKTKITPKIESLLQKNENIHPKRYTYAEVKRMTKSFAVKLGQGGFGVVYRGNLADGREVAVKILKDNKGDGEEFMNEVSSISRTSHANVVMLLGFCLQGSKRALVYEYMPNGSLERYAFSSNLLSDITLTWEKLFDIAIGIARGLEYLHRGCNTRIVHFDIKPHNILLDQDFCPKISDFGLAKLCLNKESDISIAGARGTIGYIAPEVYSKQFGTVSSKSDVYSYGMMVFEMVGERDKNTNGSGESSSKYFPQWIYDHLDDYCVSASEINGETTELVRKMIVVGLWCIQINPTHRPTMTRVVEMLEGSTSILEPPPKNLLTWDRDPRQSQSVQSRRAVTPSAAKLAKIAPQQPPSPPPPDNARKVVLYLTSLRGIHKTYEDCWSAKSILHGYGVRVDERDLSMHAGFKDELHAVLGAPGRLPQVFADGKHLGGAEEIHRMHETGELSSALESCDMAPPSVVCKGIALDACSSCGGVRFVPCDECSGSCKVFLEDVGSFRRCPECNENGLVRCPLCSL